MGRHPCESCGQEGWDYSDNYCPAKCGYAEDGTDICPDCMVEVECDVCGMRGCDSCVSDHECVCRALGKNKDLICCGKKSVCGKGCQRKLEPVVFACGHYVCMPNIDADEGDEGDDGDEEDEEEEAKKPNKKQKKGEEKESKPAEVRTSPKNCSSCGQLKASREEYQLRQDAEILATRGDMKQIKSQVSFGKDKSHIY